MKLFLPTVGNNTVMREIGSQARAEPDQLPAISPGKNGYKKKNKARKNQTAQYKINIPGNPDDCHENAQNPPVGPNGTPLRNAKSTRQTATPPTTKDPESECDPCGLPSTMREQGQTRETRISLNGNATVQSNVQ
jgi:hypothetical protein